MTLDTGHWIYTLDFNPDEWFGFVYRIINKMNGKEYIGKKQFRNTVRKKVVGKKNRKITYPESNWKKYLSSSDYVKADIALLGKDSFVFIIESLHKTKGSLSYREVEIQINEDVLRTKLNLSDEKKYYNRAIGNIKFIPPDTRSDETRHKMSPVVLLRHKNLSDDDRKAISNGMSGETNPVFGRNLCEEYDDVKAVSIKQKKSEATKERMRKPKSKQN